jgi:[glutamine synthetase] adenylyltransferase / [glutamine synthetase]-adenylyl-L-tyrosine phosphorylase
MTAPNIKDLLLAPRLDRQTVASLLEPYGLKDVSRADANLQTIAADPLERQLLASILGELLNCVSQSASPDQALTYFERFVRAGLNKTQLFSYLHSSPQALEILVRSLGGSSYMAEILIRDPDLLYWVSDPQILRRPRTKREIQREIIRTAKALATEQQQLDYLRSLKRREMLHIGMRDLLRLSSVEETWKALSVLAEALISGAYWICASALRQEFGISGPAFTGFTVIAMGKLGGGELNFSSDVDLMYLYASSGESASGVAAGDFFRRLSQKITLGLSNLTGEGYVYRVDLRLRPEGNSGNIADALEGFRRYYETRLASWERLALLKAWPVAGDRALGSAFLAMAQNFIYAGAFGEQAVQDVLTMKRKIDEKVAGRRMAGRNVKLGPGGIREIELIAQSLQVCYGGRISQIRERNTIRALKALCEHSLLSDDEHEALAKAYVFLRDVENKLQMVHDTQTHSLPVDDDELAACANLIGYRREANGGSPVQAFERDYSHHTAQVSRLFAEFIGSADLKRFSRLL